MGGPVTLMLLVILLLLLISVVGVFMWQRTHADSSGSIDRTNENGNTRKNGKQKRRFTEDDRQALLLIRELADIINTVDRRL
ncbi:MAG: hypothetical protein K2M91_16225 [Lachnospiraceae bacterium]|nr:hypothetical protein [Lachnospiraceae bacterium]